MLIEGLYDPRDLYLLESQALKEMKKKRDPNILKTTTDKTPLFIEDVGKYLWKCWMKNNDSRILEYIVPVIQNRVSRLLQISKFPQMHPHEAFNIIFLGVVKALPRYNPKKGLLFSYLLTITTYRVYDIAKPKKDLSVEINEADFLTHTDTSAHNLADFITFIHKLKHISGKTDNKILNALLRVLSPDHALNCHEQSSIISFICRETKLPEILVTRFYKNVLDRYKFSVLD